MNEESAQHGAFKNRAAIIFSSDLTRKLATDSARMPPTAIGVRRVRPSSSTVQDVWQRRKSKSSNIVATDQIVYRMLDSETGMERRMTKQEKKDAKLKRREEQKLLKQKERDRRLLDETEEDKKGSDVKRKSSNISAEVAEWLEQNSYDGERYLPFKINPAALEQELADLKGERDGVPPVVLSPPMARVFMRSIDGHGSLVSELPECVFSDELSSEWAAQLKNAMKAAETVRSQEDMRPMVYDLIPEVWRRGRPNTLGKIQISQTQGKLTWCADINHKDPDWSPCTMSSEPCTDHAAVAQVLHQGTHLHASCGSKFGCDFLLYDRPRAECHAFAGLRVLRTTVDHDGGTRLPIPTSYDMTGFVRCLNTAGKLALLATVKKTTPSFWQVAIVDLSLVKIEQKNSPKKRKKTKQPVNSTT